MYLNILFQLFGHSDMKSIGENLFLLSVKDFYY